MLFWLLFRNLGRRGQKNIIAQLLYTGFVPTKQKGLETIAPFVGITETKAIANLPRPRLLHYHMAYNDVPKSSTYRYVFVARNPKDVCVSFFHHTTAFVDIYNWKNGNFDTFFKLFFSGQMAYGSWFDYMHEWSKHFQDDNVLVVKYEDMLVDVGNTVKQIANFLGETALKSIATEKQLADIVENCSFSHMSKQELSNFMSIISMPGEQTFFRKGKKKDWINYFSKEQSEMVDQLWREKMCGTVMEHWWSEDMKYTSPSEEKVA